MSGEVHVTYRQEQEVWAVKLKGNLKAHSLHSIREEAIKAGHQFAESFEADLLIHRENGKLKEHHYYGE